MDVNWARLFVPSDSLVELVIRGSIIYLAALCFMRILRRQGGSFTRADLLFITLHRRRLAERHGR